MDETPPGISTPIHDKRRARPLFDPPIVRRAITDSFVKLNPRTMMKNPVMFVVWVGSLVTTLIFFKDIVKHVGGWEHVLRRADGPLALVHGAVR